MKIFITLALSKDILSVSCSKNLPDRLKQVALRKLWKLVPAYGEISELVEYGEDFNCTNISVQKHGKLIFQDIGKRLSLTPSRIKQIENAALKKMKIRAHKSLNIL